MHAIPCSHSQVTNTPACSRCSKFQQVSLSPKLRINIICFNTFEAISRERPTTTKHQSSKPTHCPIILRTFTVKSSKALSRQLSSGNSHDTDKRVPFPKSWNNHNALHNHFSKAQHQQIPKSEPTMIRSTRFKKGHQIHY